MEEEIISANDNSNTDGEPTKIPEVYTLRSWKEYVGESILIIFSVLLALIVTEYINNLHEKISAPN